MRPTLLSCAFALITGLACAQEPPRRGTYGDKAYMGQMQAARDLVEILADGRKAGLSSFFERSSYADSIQPVLDSLAAAWGLTKENRIVVGGEIDGPENSMRTTVFTADRKLLGQVLTSYSPKDVISLVRRFEVVPQEKIIWKEDEFPPEEPPPTQEQLIQTRPKR
jgi:hypothetical protein